MQEDLKGFWCDGVSPSPLPESQLAPKQIHDTRQITTTAWLGKSGQEEYELTIHFGRQALSRYAKGSPLDDCIPNEEAKDWLRVDVDHKTAGVWLD